MNDDILFHITDRQTGDQKEISLSDLIDLIHTYEERQSKDIQVLPIITSHEITLSFRPHGEGSISLECDTDESPVYIGISIPDINVSILSVSRREKRRIRYISSTEDILLPLSGHGITHIKIDMEYNGQEIFINAILS